jgi:SAM-dependent methyltransferase
VPVLPRRTAQRFPIEGGIPRFVGPNTYADSFGLQWNAFRAEQIDSLNGFRFSERRFYAETGWTAPWLSGKWILEAGCGAGRFLDVASQAGADVVGIDLSDAVDAARRTFRERPNVHLVQASLYALPFRAGAFDGCYSLGVIRAVRCLPEILKPGGRLALFIYERKPWTRWYAKYLLRPMTRRLPARVLLGAIWAAMPALFLLTEVLFRLPGLGRVFRFLIPVRAATGGRTGD